jgi:hypothetical protein
MKRYALLAAAAALAFSAYAFTAQKKADAPCPVTPECPCSHGK